MESFESAGKKIFVETEQVRSTIDTPSSRSIVVALHNFYKGLYREFSDRSLGH